MSSTYSTNLALELIGTGDQAGNWGSTTNTNLGTLLEQAISGYVTQGVTTGTDTTITIPNGATGVARNMFIELTGTGGASTNLIVPSNKKLYFIYNNSTGAVTVKVTGLTGVSVPAAAKMVLVSNGTDIITATNYLASLTLGAALPVASGGTGLASYATGDLLYASGSTTLAKLTLGTSGYVLTASGSAPAYVAQSTLSVGTATNATNTGITANSTNATNYLTFVSATTGNLPQLVNSAITCNPSTGVITGGISGGTF
jgi:hypothetical protein